MDRTILRSCFVLLFLTGFSTTALARNCTPDEREEANELLLAIQADNTRNAALIKDHLPLGQPLSGQDSQGGPDNEYLLVQGSYVMVHDEDLRTTLWVSYQLTKDDIDNAQGKTRVNCFRQDPRMEYAETATPADYVEPIFDQGHMANDADMKDEVVDQVNTYMMSNMSPQYCRFNRGIWLSMEELGRAWAEEYESVYIMSGAIFDQDNVAGRDADDSASRMQSNNGKSRVAIPSGYYKVFLREEAGDWHAFSFLFEQSNDAHGTRWADVRPAVEAAMSTVEDIEVASSQDMFPDIERDELIQNDMQQWDLSLGGSNLEGGCP